MEMDDYPLASTALAPNELFKGPHWTSSKKRRISVLAPESNSQLFSSCGHLMIELAFLQRELGSVGFVVLCTRVRESGSCFDGFYRRGILVVFSFRANAEIRSWYTPQLVSSQSFIAANICDYLTAARII
jgi:hypothetical protein